MNAAREPPTSQGLQWPLLVAAMIVVQMTAGAGATYLALRDPAHTVTPGYHARALAWDEEAARRDASAKLGWGAAAEILGAPGQRKLRVTLHDRAGQPVDGATVQATVFHHARGKEIANLSLAPAGPGAYAAALAAERSGVWEVRLTVRRGNDTFHWTDVAEHRLEAAP